MNESDGEKELKERIQSIPLLERLDKSQDMIAKMCSEGRPPKMSIPLQWDDDDCYISQTLKDAGEVINNLYYIFGCAVDIEI